MKPKSNMKTATSNNNNNNNNNNNDSSSHISVESNKNGHSRELAAVSNGIYCNEDNSSCNRLVLKRNVSFADAKYIVVPLPIDHDSEDRLHTHFLNHDRSTSPSSQPSTSSVDFFLGDHDHRSGASSPKHIEGPQQYMRQDSIVYSSEDGTMRLITDGTSIRSLTSISLGCTDGKKLIIKHVPSSPAEFVKTCGTPPNDRFDVESFDYYVDDSDSLKPRRTHWENKMQFVLACIGYSVGLGNVWRFPYLCYKSGGGIFLIPYFIILIICGIPLLFMELAVGQYTGRGPIGAIGQMCPLLKGAGVASIVISFLMSTYYSVIIAYAIYYFFTSFRSDLPWMQCSIRWATPDCWNPDTMLLGNISRPVLSRSPTEEFFENKVLRISDGIQYPGSMRWELVACLICAWVLVYFALWKSIKSASMSRVVVATLPFILIIVFLARSLTLEGADLGLKFFFKPNWSRLGDVNVWLNAASQVFNSLGIVYGSMIAFASYNKYNNNMLHDTLAVTFVNVTTCMLVGIFAFATLGNIAAEQGVAVDKVITDGPGFIFVVYTQALAKMPASQMWAVIFFFALLCLGLNNQFAFVEVVVSSIQDAYPNWIKKKLVYHELLVFIVCGFSLILGIPQITQSGIYVFQLVDHYVATIGLVSLAFFETIAVGWICGVERLSKGIKQMTGKRPSLYYRSCWCFFIPVLLLTLFIFSISHYKAPTYHNGQYTYPGWAQGVGWSLVAIALMCIPCYAIITLAKADGDKVRERFRNTLVPHIYECKICGEHHCDHLEDAVMMQNDMVQLVPETPSPKIVVAKTKPKEQQPCSSKSMKDEYK